MERNVVRIDPRDNVGVVLREVLPGEVLTGPGVGGVVVRERVLKHHKAALADIAQGAAVIKYGERIGSAARPIRAGEWVHGHNLADVEGP